MFTPEKTNVETGSNELEVLEQKSQKLAQQIRKAEEEKVALAAEIKTEIGDIFSKPKKPGNRKIIRKLRKAAVFTVVALVLASAAGCREKTNISSSTMSLSGRAPGTAGGQSSQRALREAGIK